MRWLTTCGSHDRWEVPCHEITVGLMDGQSLASVLEAGERSQVGAGTSHSGDLLSLRTLLSSHFFSVHLHHAPWTHWHTKPRWQTIMDSSSHADSSSSFVHFSTLKPWKARTFRMITFMMGTLKKNNFIYLWLYWLLLLGIPLLWWGGATRCGARASHCGGFSGRWARVLGCGGFRSCHAWAQWLWFAGFGAQVQQLWHTSSVAPWHVGSSWIKDWTHVSCIGRRTLDHWATRETSWWVIWNIQCVPTCMSFICS